MTATKTEPKMFSLYDYDFNRPLGQIEITITPPSEDGKQLASIDSKSVIGQLVYKDLISPGQAVLIYPHYPGSPEKGGYVTTNRGRGLFLFNPLNDADGEKPIKRPRKKVPALDLETTLDATIHAKYTRIHPNWFREEDT